MQDADLPEVLAVVQGGIHEPERMPFYFPWTDATGDELSATPSSTTGAPGPRCRPRGGRSSSACGATAAPAGSRPCPRGDFAVTRTGETGSWLGLPFHGRGTGTLMRQAICVLCFDHLGFTEITSGAFLDNPESRAVSRKVGYVENGGSGSSGATPGR